MPLDLATTPTFTSIVKTMSDAKGGKEQDSDPKLKFNRCRIVLMNAKNLPDLSKKTELKTVKLHDIKGIPSLSKVMRLVGYSYDESQGGGTAYAKISRWRGKYKKSQSTVPVLQQIQPNNQFGMDFQHTHPLPPTKEVVFKQQDVERQSLSPISSSICSFATTSKNTTVSAVFSSKHTCQKSLNSNFCCDTNVKLNRKTSAQADADKREEQNLVNTRAVAFKVGSILLDAHKNGRLPHKDLDGPEDIAREVNKLLRHEVISGDEIKRAISKNQVGLSPVRCGPKGKVNDEDTSLIAFLVFSAATIDQVNCSVTTMNRQEVISAIGKMVNQKLEKDSVTGSDQISLYCQIEQINSTRLSVKTTNRCEEIRTRWLTYSNLKAHYENFEEFLCEFGFASRPNPEDEQFGKHGKEYVKFGENVLHRILNFDEMPFSLDGSTNGVGGQKPGTNTNLGVTQPGMPTNKSSNRVTIIFGINFASEALPPLIITQSKAKDPRIKAKMILDCHQVEGKYGFNNVRKHDTMLAASAKGGMNSQIFSKWAEKIYDLYPSARDADNHRVCMKADSGPGRHTNDFLIQSRSRGFLFYPGLCHVTEEVQEMDQEYAKTKTAMENNRDELYKARHNANPSKLTPIDESDVPVLLFGGKVPIEDGSIVELENAFEKSFNKESIKRSLEKCGYCPATRAGLRSTKLRRGVRSDDQDSKLQSDEKQFEEMIKEIEVENHKTVKILIEKGYTTATVFQ